MEIKYHPKDKFMQDKLFENLNSWTREKSLAFHNYKLPNTNEDNLYIWRTDENGISLWNNVNSFFFKENGEVHKLTFRKNMDDWNEQVSLHKAVNNENSSVRIEIPLYVEQTEKYNYYMLRRPNNQIGKGLFEMVALDKINDDLIIEVITQNKKIFELIKNNCNFFPVVPKVLFDDRGPFWSDFKHWKYSEEEYIRHSLGNINKFITTLDKNYKKSIDTVYIFDQVQKIWNL